MEALGVAFREMLAANGELKLLAEHRFTEILSFSSAGEILAFLDAETAVDFLRVPVWVRNLGFRLACLQRPADAQLLRKAAADLECFGPDWDDWVARLRQRAEELEKVLP